MSSRNAEFQKVYRGIENIELDRIVKKALGYQPQKGDFTDLKIEPNFVEWLTELSFCKLRPPSMAKETDHRGWVAFCLVRLAPMFSATPRPSDSDLPKLAAQLGHQHLANLLFGNFEQCCAALRGNPEQNAYPLALLDETHNAILRGFITKVNYARTTVSGWHNTYTARLVTIVTNIIHPPLEETIMTLLTKRTNAKREEQFIQFIEIAARPEKQQHLSLATESREEFVRRFNRIDDFAKWLKFTFPALFAVLFLALRVEWIRPALYPLLLLNTAILSALVGHTFDSVLWRRGIQAKLSTLLDVEESE